jgi:hypothetical protein
MIGRSKTRSLPKRQRSIYGPDELARLRMVDLEVPKPPIVQRADSYRSSLYANRHVYMQDGKTTRRRYDTDESMDSTSSHSSPSPSSSKRSLRKLAKKRTAGAAADLFVVYMLTQGLASASD